VYLLSKIKFFGFGRGGQRATQSVGILGDTVGVHEGEGGESEKGETFATEIRYYGVEV